MLKIVKGEMRKNKNDNGRHFSWRFTIATGKYKGKTLYMVTSLKTDALWNLRNLIFAATGKNVAGKVSSFDPSTIEGKVVAGTTEDDEYEGKIKSVLVDIRPKEELGGDDEDEDDEDEEEEDDDEYEDEEDEEEEDDEEEDEDEDEDEDEEDEEPEPPRKKRRPARATTTKKPARKKRKAEDLDEIDVDDI
jgi:hypothetical protein